MLKQLSKRFSSVPLPVALIAVIIGIIGVAGAAFLLSRSEPKAEALSTPRAARIERVEGDVGLAHSLEPDAANQDVEDQTEWTEAVVNTPITVGDRVYTRDNSRAAIAFTGRNYARLDPGASLDVMSLADSRTQLALRDGSALFDVGELADGELFEVATPGGAVDFNEPGLYQVGIGDDGNTIVSVLSGLAQVVGLEGSGQIEKGEILTLVGQAATQLLVSKLAPDLAGNIVDDYYGYRYPNTYDGRYRNYDTYVDDPDYYDPYSHSASYDYLSEDIPGLYDLDQYGDWEDVDGYGRCWTPRVEADWSPYRSGYWDVNNVWGPTWVAEEPWGYAPYHYGRWAYINNHRWTWVPEDCRTNPVYAPALVTFVPLQQTGQIAWAPLGPGERYLSRYYDANFHPQYFASREVVTEVVNVQHNYVNLNYPTAVTVVPVREFRHRIDRRVIVPANAQLIAQSRGGTDAFAVDGVRQLAKNGEFAERRMKGPRRNRAEAFNAPVVTSVAPVIPPGRGGFQVQAVTEKQRKNKLKVDNSGQVVASRRPDGLPEAMTHKVMPAVNQERQQKMAELSQRVQQGDKSAQTELRSLKREQRNEERAVRQMPANQQQINQQQRAAQQAIQQGQSRREMKQLERQQRAAGQQAQADQIKEQLRAQRQQQLQRREVTAQQQQRPVVQQGQMKQQRQAERAQRQAAAQGQVNQQREQMKQQRQMQQQQQQNQQRQNQAAAQQAQVNQAREARKSQRQQQMVQQQSIQRQQVRQQQQQVQRQQQAQQQRQQVVQMQRAQQQQQRQQMKQQRQVERQPQIRQQPQMRPPASSTPDARTHQPGQGQGQGKRRKP
ncbi:MAG: DUF6600 domain-containing protein [Blastocatellia bacterium]